MRLPEWFVVPVSRLACRMGRHNVTCRGKVPRHAHLPQKGDK